MDKSKLNSKLAVDCSVSHNTYAVDSFANGIAFGQQKFADGDDPRDNYQLRIDDQAESLRLRSRYPLTKNNPLIDLERHLMRLSAQGVLRRSAIYFGTTTDPFHPFENKFDASMKFLELFKRYTPGHLNIQTRSPLIVIAMPVIRQLEARCTVTLGVETDIDESARCYTPHLPRPSERLKAATALRRFGVEVTLQVAPVLPYGDWRADAGRFAEVLDKHADYIHVKPLTDGSPQTEKIVKYMPLAKRLADDRKFHWLRSDSANPLIAAIKAIAQPKLLLPKRPYLEDKQVKLFG